MSVRTGSTVGEIPRGAVDTPATDPAVPAGVDRLRLALRRTGLPTYGGHARDEAAAAAQGSWAR